MCLSLLTVQCSPQALQSEYAFTQALSGAERELGQDVLVHAGIMQMEGITCGNVQGRQEGHSSDNICKERARSFLGHERSWWKFGSSHPIYHPRLCSPRQCAHPRSTAHEMAVPKTQLAVMNLPPGRQSILKPALLHTCRALHATLIGCHNSLLLPL